MCFVILIKEIQGYADLLQIPLQCTERKLRKSGLIYYVSQIRDRRLLVVIIRIKEPRYFFVDQMIQTDKPGKPGQMRIFRKKGEFRLL